MTAAAVFFSIVRVLGYVDAFFVFAATAFLFRIVLSPRRVRVPTSVVLTIVAGALIWANLRPIDWELQFDVNPPDGLDPITRAMFWRGWPICPFMLCRMQHMAFQPSGPLPAGALVINAFTLVAALMAVKAVCGRCFPPHERRATAASAKPEDSRGAVAFGDSETADASE
jgi:hypothetical protein